MANLTAKFKDTVFVVTESANCPFYFKGDEMEVKDGSFRLSKGGGLCLILAHDVAKIVSTDQPIKKEKSLLPDQGNSGQMQCSGCQGVVKFVRKQNRQYQTEQMKILAEAQRNAKLSEARVYFKVLRGVELFSVLSDDELMIAGQMLEFEEFPWQFPVIEKGAPGDRLIILLEGKVEVIDEQGSVLEELEEGEVVGEMSLLSGERVGNTVMTVTPCRVGTLNKIDFKTIINRFPVLQHHFYKLLVSRIHERSEQREEVVLTSGMAGQLVDISPVELCQMINTSMKTGQLKFKFTQDDGQAEIGVVLFREGEVVGALFRKERGKDAFFNMLTMSKGRFQFVPGLDKKQSSLEPIAAFMGLIMEGVQYIDDVNE